MRLAGMANEREREREREEGGARYCLRPPRCVSTGPVVVRLAGMANEREREREREEGGASDSTLRDGQARHSALRPSLVNLLTYFPVESPARLETRVETASRRFKFKSSQVYT